MTKKYEDRLKKYGSKQDIIAKNISGGIACCSGYKTYHIYECWGEAVLCSYCEQVKQEGIADAMSGTSGSMFITYRTYDDFLSGFISGRDESGIRYG